MHRLIPHHRSRQQRVVVTLLALLLLVGACASKPEVKRVGIVNSFETALTELVVAELDTLGWVEGETITVVFGAGETPEEQAADLVDQEVDLMVGLGGPASFAISEAGRERGVPSLTAATANLSADLTRDGLTGVQIVMAPGRLLEIVLRVFPVERVLVGVHGDQASQSSFAQIESDLTALGLTVVRADLGGTEGAADALAAAIVEHPDVDAVLLAATAALRPAFGDLVQATVDAGTPMVAIMPMQNDGALFTYTFSEASLSRDIAGLADDLLAGEDPNDTPFRNAFLELHVHQGTADKLGIEIPVAILEQATSILP